MPLGKRGDCADAKYAGVEVPFSCDIVETLEVKQTIDLQQASRMFSAMLVMPPPGRPPVAACRSPAPHSHPSSPALPLWPPPQSSLLCGFDFVMAPLVHPRYRRPAPSALPRGTVQPPFTRSDLLLTSGQWGGQIVGKVSPWIDCDSPNPTLQRDSHAALEQELGWAAHLSLQAVVLPPPPQPLNAANYARILNHTIGGLTTMALWLRIPATAPPASCSDGSSSGGGGGSSSSSLAADPWEWWNQLRFLCHHHVRLGVLLELGADLPSEESLQRWRGEPLK
jgi:protein arginine N-methyltransferase 5